MNGLQCRKRLWVEAYAPQHIGRASPTQAQLRAQGRTIGQRARAQFPDGLLIRATGHAALAATQAALAAGHTCLFEAAFLHNGVFVRADILRRAADGAWTLTEVKSTTQVKQHHLHDLAVQQWVAEGSGLRLGRVELMHLNNRTCVYPNLDALFVTVDVTKPVRRVLPQVARQVRRLQQTLARKSAPSVAVGAQCSQPTPCPVRGHCWRDIPPHSIFTIPRLSPRALAALQKLGIMRVHDIPPTFPLTPPQWAYVARVIAGRAEIAWPRIADRLADLRYPIHFLDFETYTHAVPQFDGMRPYQHLPFQYSCHVLEADGALHHRDYLHTDHDDPRPKLAAQLAQDVATAGSVVVYHARFERAVLRELAHTLPNHRAALHSIAARLWDQLDIFRYDYLDPAFEGSNSIKRVLPVLVPELSYADLAVQRGDQAQAVWQLLLQTDDPAQRAQLRDHLRAYCQRDTYAMVAIHHSLQRRMTEADDPPAAPDSPTSNAQDNAQDNA